MGCCGSRQGICCDHAHEPTPADEHCKQLTDDCELFALGQQAFRWYFRLGRADLIIFQVDCWENEGRVVKSWTFPVDAALVSAVRYLGVSEEKSVVGVEVAGERGGAWILEGDTFYWTEGGLLPHAVNGQAIAVHQGALVVRRILHERTLPVRALPHLAHLWTTVPPASLPRGGPGFRYREGYCWFLAKTDALWCISADNEAPALAYRSFEDLTADTFALPPWTAIHPGGDGFVYVEADEEKKVLFVNSSEIVCASSQGCVIIANVGEPFVVDGDVVEVTKISRFWAAEFGPRQAPRPRPNDPSPERERPDERAPEQERARAAIPDEETPLLCPVPRKSPAAPEDRRRAEAARASAPDADRFSSRVVALDKVPSKAGDRSPAQEAEPRVPQTPAGRRARGADRAPEDSAESGADEGRALVSPVALAIPRDGGAPPPRKTHRRSRSSGGGTQ